MMTQGLSSFSCSNSFCPWNVMYITQNISHVTMATTSCLLCLGQSFFYILISYESNHTPSGKKTVTGLQAVNASQVQYSYHVTMATTARLLCLGQLFNFFLILQINVVHDCSFNWLTEFKLLLPFLLLAVSLHLQPLVESPAVILLLWTFWLIRNEQLGANWKELCLSCMQGGAEH